MKLREHPPSRTSPCGPGGTCRALTLIDLIALIALVAFLGYMVLIRLTARGGSGRSTIIPCANNLKQIGVAYRLFGVDNGDRFPAQLSTNEGGTKELGARVFVQFAALSNELGTPLILRCPKDNRLAATNFATLSDTNLSYFASLDANELEPGMILSGHRNLTVNGRAVPPGLVSLTNGHALAWTSALHSTNSATLYADGSVMLLSGLTVATNHLTTNLINRLAVP